MKYADRVNRLAGEAADAWEIHVIAAERVRAGEDVIMLSVGDTDFDSPAPAVEEAHASLLRGRTNYASICGELPLRQTIARHCRDACGVDVDPASVVVSLGAQNALYSTAQCLLDPGCEVIVPEPMYVTYPATIEGTGAHMVRVPSRAENNFHPTMEDIAAAITEKTRAIFLATPNNPTGAVYTRDEMEGIAELCREHDLWLVSDEVYGLLSYDVPHTSALALDDMAERTVVINSLSKSHAMAGWRLGWALVPPTLAEHMELLALCSTYGTPTFIQDAAIAALDSLPKGIDGMKESYDRRRKSFCNKLDALPGLACAQPEGGMFAMLDVRDSGMTAQEFAMGLLNQQRLSTLPADAFGPSAKGFLRINMAVPDATLKTVAGRIEAFVNS